MVVFGENQQEDVSKFERGGGSWWWKSGERWPLLCSVFTTHTISFSLLQSVSLLLDSWALSTFGGEIIDKKTTP